MASGEVVQLRVSVDIGELPGILYTEDLIVTYVQRSGALEDRVFVGDQILEVNDHSVRTRRAFNEILQKHNITSLTVNRQKERGEKIKEEQQVDDKKITKRPGFLYLKVKMTERKADERLGLTLKNNTEGHVYVTRVIQGSLSSGCLMVGDRILQIDETTISDKELAKKIILKGLSSKGITLILERPDSAAARNIAAEVMAIRTPPNSDKA